MRLRTSPLLLVIALSDPAASQSATNLGLEIPHQPTGHPPHGAQPVAPQGPNHYRY